MKYLAKNPTLLAILIIVFLTLPLVIAVNFWSKDFLASSKYLQSVLGNRFAFLFLSYLFIGIARYLFVWHTKAMPQKSRAFRHIVNSLSFVSIGIVSWCICGYWLSSQGG